VRGRPLSKSRYSRKAKGLLLKTGAYPLREADKLFSTRMRKFYSWFIGLLLLPLFVSYLIFINIASSPHWDTDYLYLYFSAQQVFKHFNIYYPLHFFSASLNGITEAVNLNPPLLAILMVPFCLTNYTLSFWIWSLLNLFLAVLSTLLIVKTLFQPKENNIPITPQDASLDGEFKRDLNYFDVKSNEKIRTFEYNGYVYLTSILLLFAYFPFFINIYAQTGILVFFLTTLGWITYRKNKLELAGLLFGIAFSIKIFMGLFLWIFFWRKEWRCLTTFFLTSIICVLINTLILGPSVYLNYYHIFERIKWYSASWNASLLGFFSRFFGYANEKNHAIIHFPKITPWIYSIVTIMLLATFRNFSKPQFPLLPSLASPAKNSLHKLMTADLAVAYTIVVMLLISPLAWVYYFLLLLLPLAIIFYWNQHFFHQQSTILFLAIALFCSSIPHTLLKPHQIIEYSDIFLWSGTYFYALVILAILIFKMNFSLKKEKLYLDKKNSMKNINTPTLISLLIATLLPSLLGILTIICFISIAQ